MHDYQKEEFIKTRDEMEAEITAEHPLSLRYSINDKSWVMTYKGFDKNTGKKAFIHDTIPLPVETAYKTILEYSNKKFTTKKSNLVTLSIMTSFSGLQTQVPEDIQNVFPILEIISNPKNFNRKRETAVEAIVNAARVTWFMPGSEIEEEQEKEKIKKFLLAHNGWQPITKDEITFDNKNLRFTLYCKETNSSTSRMFTIARDKLESIFETVYADSQENVLKRI